MIGMMLRNGECVCIYAVKLCLLLFAVYDVMNRFGRQVCCVIRSYSSLHLMPITLTNPIQFIYLFLDAKFGAHLGAMITVRMINCVLPFPNAMRWK